MRQIRQKFRAFTLIEILVVVGIIAVLMGILVAAIGGAQRSAQKAATVAILNSIRTGIGQYFSDFNVYPQSMAGNGVPANRGDSMLAEALNGWQNSASDGAGPPGDPALGFRLIRNATMGGKVYGPYGPQDAKSFSRTIPCNFIDSWGRPILYYRSTRVGPPNPSASLPAIVSVFGTGNGNDFYFDIGDCLAVPGITDPSSAPAAFFAFLGAPGNGLPKPMPVAGSTSYVLISAGPDELYFTADDVVVSP